MVVRTRILTALLVFLGSAVLAGSSSYEEELVLLSQKRGLAQTRQWEALLFYRPKLLKSRQSFLSDMRFFLTPDGGTDPRGELEATIRGFFDPEIPKAEGESDQVNLHPQCRYPARFEWLNGQLNFDLAKLKRIHCPLIEDLMADLNPDKVSFVFSSAHINNPASMFGHTFLRVHRKSEGKGTQSAMLDYAINFSAFPDTRAPLLYSFKGLTGQFPGYFDLMPYFLKVQEYNSGENRDLWEYELNLAPAQVRLLVLSLFDIAQYRIQYYYLDDNCSLLMLSLLEIANPSLDLVSKHPVWTTPADTVRTVTSSPGLVRERRFRPSTLTKFLARTEKLDGRERRILKDLLDENNADKARELLSPVAKASKVKILDSALDYIDFREKLVENQKPVFYANLRAPLLAMRAASQVRSEELETTPLQADPGAGHGSTRLALGNGYVTDKGALTRLDWRPALHDFTTPARGYTDELEIRFLDTAFQYNYRTRDFYLSRFRLMEILSLAPWKIMLQPLSWRFSLGMDTETTCPAGERCYRKFVQVGGGISSSLNSHGNLLAYGMAMVDLGSTNSRGQEFHAGPGLTAGLSWALTEDAKWSVYGTGLVHFGGQTVWDWRLGTELAYIFENDYELRGSYRRWERNEEFLLSIGRFF